MFKLFGQGKALDQLQGRYCKASYEQCMRYRLSTQNKPVPIQLMPNGVLLGSRSK